MNAIELFYEIFRMRYSVDEIKRSFADRYSLCLMGSAEDCTRMREWMGDYSLSSGIHPEKNLCVVPIPEDEDEANAYRNMEAIVCHLGVEPWPLEEFAELVECMPTGVPILYICEPVAWEGEFEEYAAANLPEVFCLRAGHEDKHFARLLFSKFQRLGFRLARDYQNLRDVCVESLINGTANRMAIVAAASSISVNVPLIGQLLALLASPVETLAITAAQLRMILYIGALYGRPIDFFDRINELWMVVGGGWGWRTLARQLVGFVPGVGSVAKAGIAWAGTFAVGEISRRFYELGEEVPVNIREVVSNKAKRKVTRAIRMKFKNDATEAAVSGMLNEDAAEAASASAPALKCSCGSILEKAEEKGEAAACSAAADEVNDVSAAKASETPAAPGAIEVPAANGVPAAEKTAEIADVVKAEDASAEAEGNDSSADAGEKTPAAAEDNDASAALEADKAPDIAEEDEASVVAGADEDTLSEEDALLVDYDLPDMPPAPEPLMDRQNAGEL